MSTSGPDIDAVMLSVLEPFSQLVNEVIRFRQDKLLGVVAIDAVHSDPEVRMVDAWLSGLPRRASGARR